VVLRSGHSQRYIIFFSLFVFSLAERKNEQQMLKYLAAVRPEFVEGQAKRRVSALERTSCKHHATPAIRPGSRGRFDQLSFWASLIRC